MYNELSDDFWTAVGGPSFRVTTCLEKTGMSRNFAAVREMSGISVKIREMTRGKFLKFAFSVIH